MFKTVRQPEPSPDQNLIALLATLLRHRAIRVVLGISFLAISVVSFFGASLIHRAKSASCDEVQRVDLTLEEMGQIKRKVDMHRLGDPLSITGEEASFILNDHLRVPIHLQTQHDELLAHLALPDNGRCWNVMFRGTVQVDDGIAQIVPTELHIGNVDLSSFARGRTIQVDHRSMGEHPARKLLSSTQLLTLQDDKLIMKISNIAALR